MSRRPTTPIRSSPIDPRTSIGPRGPGIRLDPLDPASYRDTDVGRYWLDPDDLRVLAALPPPPTPRAAWYVLDAWDEAWEIEEVRATDHGFALVLGRPAEWSGPHGRATVLTADLKAYLDRHRRDPRGIRLPISRTVIKRLRRLLGHNWYDDGERWWIERIADLELLPTADFCVRYRVKPAAVLAARREMIGPGQRPAGWWRDPAIATLLLSHQPRAAVAAKLDVSVQTVARLRADLRRDAGEPMTPTAVYGRISASKTGVPATEATRAALLAAARAPKSADWRDQLAARNRARVAARHHAE